jgi:hypothetical protein
MHRVAHWHFDGDDMERDRMKNGLVLALWAFAALAFGADAPDDLQARIDAARARLDAAARELAELHKQDTFQVQLPEPGIESRVSFGVLLVPGSKDGVAIAGVTPGGPAAEAGIEAGDVVVTINGTNLRDGMGKPPLARVFDVLKDAAPGDIVRVEYLRNGEMLSADVTAADPIPSPATNVSFTTMAFSNGPGEPPSFAGRAIIGGLELFDLNEELGHYFGVSDGVLVLSTPPDNGGRGLKPGDVVRAVDGRSIASSAECVTALGGHSGDVAVEVLRDGAATTVQVQGAGGPALIAMPPMGEVHAVRAMRVDQPLKGASGAGVIITAPMNVTPTTSGTRSD